MWAWHGHLARGIRDNTLLSRHSDHGQDAHATFRAHNATGSLTGETVCVVGAKRLDYLLGWNGINERTLNRADPQCPRGLVDTGSAGRELSRPLK